MHDGCIAHHTRARGADTATTNHDHQDAHQHHSQAQVKSRAWDGRALMLAAAP